MLRRPRHNHPRRCVIRLGGSVFRRYFRRWFAVWQRLCGLPRVCLSGIAVIPSTLLHRVWLLAPTHRTHRASTCLPLPLSWHSICLRGILHVVGDRVRRRTVGLRIRSRGNACLVHVPRGIAHRIPSIGIACLLWRIGRPGRLLLLLLGGGLRRHRTLPCALPSCAVWPLQLHL